MENDKVVNGLLRRRQEVAQGQVRQLVLDLDALDATLRLFRPDVESGWCGYTRYPGGTRRCGTSPRG